MKKILLLVVALTVLSCSNNEKKKEESLNEEQAEYITPFEKGNGNQTTTYEECITFYKRLAANYGTITLEEVGTTDAGLPLHVVHYSNTAINWKSTNENKIKILVNNGIHPGESDGIDATMILLRNLATGKLKVDDNVILSAIAIYNVGGALNRNSTTRTNQNGPESYGFRGNARNYDLNRDFIKADTRNARSFAQIYHKIKPDLFIDNHVSNGADYQYTLTHLFTQHNLLGAAAGNYVHNKLQPALESGLKNRSLTITPYVNVHNKSPEEGFSQFVDYPRYSTGYTSLWNTMGLMVETHMLKPYDDRVMGTLAIMEEIINIGSNDLQSIKEARKSSFDTFQNLTYYPTSFEVDNTRADTLNFEGYEVENKVNDLTGNKLMTYNREKPYSKKVAFSNYMKATDSIKIPKYYVIPRSQWNVLELLRNNDVIFESMDKDSLMEVSSYKITNYGTSSNSYEGHYPHHSLKVDESMMKVRFRESDIMVPTNQPGIKYIMETLEPTMPDSFFKWNFFDTILQQKEGFSSYVFESTAKKLLQEDPALKKRFDSIKKANKDFAASNDQQLKWLHERSPNYETAYMTYPIYKVY